jgi:hypothetical protein
VAYYEPHPCKKSYFLKTLVVTCCICLALGLGVISVLNNNGLDTASGTNKMFEVTEENEFYSVNDISYTVNQDNALISKQVIDTIFLPDGYEVVKVTGNSIELTGNDGGYIFIVNEYYVSDKNETVVYKQNGENVITVYANVTEKDILKKILDSIS